MQLIEDPAAPELDDFRNLTDAAARRSVERHGAPGADAPHGLFVIEGLIALDAALGHGIVPRSVLLTPSRWATHGRRLETHGCDVLVVTREVLAAVTGFDAHRGVLASAPRPRPLTPAQVVAGTERLVVAEGLTDNENVGALHRSAAAFGLGGVLLDRSCADPLYRRSVRVSSGWSIAIPHARCDDLPADLRALGDSGWRTLALTPGAGAVAVDAAAAAGVFDGPFALVVGAEGDGLGAATMDACTDRVAVPMQEGVDSLNVATALAVVAAFAAARHGWSW